jgi:hypothetical protein
MRRVAIGCLGIQLLAILVAALPCAPTRAEAANARGVRQVALAQLLMLRAAPSELAGPAHQPRFALTSSTAPSTTLTLVGSYDTPGAAESVVVSGTLAFVADGFSGVQILDISTPSAPVLRGSYATPGHAIAIQVVGTLAFVTDNTHGLVILDIHNPQQPTFVGAYPLAGTTEPAQVVGTVAYVPNVPSGLVMLDIHDPSHPQLRGAYTGTGETFTLISTQVAGGYAYLVGYGESPLWINALEILDVSNPAKPVRLSHLSTDQNSGLGTIGVVGSFAYIVGGTKAGYSALVIIDVHDPVHPFQAGGYYDLPWREAPLSFDIVGGVAILSTFNQTTSTDRLFFVDVSDPAHSQLRSDYPSYIPRSGAMSIQCVGDDLYLAEGLAGLEIVRLNRPYREFFPLT